MPFQVFDVVKKHNVISMDGKGSYNDNLFIERLWQTVKYEEVYLKAYEDDRDARISLGAYFCFYNTSTAPTSHWATRHRRKYTPLPWRIVVPKW